MRKTSKQEIEETVLERKKRIEGVIFGGVGGGGGGLSVSLPGEKEGEQGQGGQAKKGALYYRKENEREKRGGRNSGRRKNRKKYTIGGLRQSKTGPIFQRGGKRGWVTLGDLQWGEENREKGINAGKKNKKKESRPTAVALKRKTSLGKKRRRKIVVAPEGIEIQGNERKTTGSCMGGVSRKE